MSDLIALARLRAHLEGRPLPVGSALPFARGARDDALVVAFVRMAGETSPWAVAWGAPGDTPRTASVPDPRRADDVRAMLSPFARGLLTHLGHPAYGAEVDPSRRRVVMPGSSHVEALHYLEYRYAKARRLPDEERDEVNAFGRLCGWLFRESRRTHQLTVLDVTRLLREAWAVPAEDLRQQHLGYLLGWLSGDAPAARVALAEAAEREAVGFTLDPAVDESLEPLVERWNDRRQQGRDDPRSAAKIREVVEAEARRRWLLAAQGWETLRDDPRPTLSTLDALAELSRDEYRRQWRAIEAKLSQGEDAFVPHPETDHAPAAAAARFFERQHSDEVGAAAVLQGDRDAVAAAVLSGEALAGRIVEVRDEGSRRSTVPVWVIDAPAGSPTRLRAGSAVEVAGSPGRCGEVRSVESVEGARRVTVEVTARKTDANGFPHAASAALVGERVALIPGSKVGIAKTKSFRVWAKTGPGAWLTHAEPRPPTPPTNSAPRRQTDLVSFVESLGGR